VLGEEARAHACVACPHGAICDDIGGNRSEAQHNTQLTLRLNTTWWRAREDSTDLRVCLPPYACDEPIAARCSPAANESAWCAGDALCRPFHHGPRCAVCDAGAFRHVDGGCVECEKAALPAVIGTSSAFGLVVAVALCSWIRYQRIGAERRRAHDRSFARMQRKARVLISFMQVGALCAPLAHGAFFCRALAADPLCVTALVVTAPAALPRMSLSSARW